MTLKTRNVFAFEICKEKQATATQIASGTSS